MKQMFVQIRCPNRLRGDRPTWECRQLLGGPSVKTLHQHDFSAGPFIEMRYCGSCNTSWKVVIRGLEDMPTFELVDERIKYIGINKMFSTIEVVGAKVRKNVLSPGDCSKED